MAGTRTFMDCFPWWWKQQCRDLVALWIGRGWLAPASEWACVGCHIEGRPQDPERRMEYHHPDYGHPLRLIALCKGCHEAWHVAYNAGLDRRTEWREWQHYPWWARIDANDATGGIGYITYTTPPERWSLDQEPKWEETLCESESPAPAT